MLVWDQKTKSQNSKSGKHAEVADGARPGKKGATAEPARATARISLNAWDEFLKFDVELNPIPIELDTVGKDVIVDWSLYDDFDTGNNLYVDANGLEMIDKKLFHRKEFQYDTNNTIAANFYPVTSAIGI